MVKRRVLSNEEEETPSKRLRSEEDSQSVLLNSFRMGTSLTKMTMVWIIVILKDLKIWTKYI
jgi:hypothetical protein